MYLFQQFLLVANRKVYGVTRFRLLLGENGDSESIIRTKAFEGGVLALPGTVFFPNGARTTFVRASFSLLEEEQVNEALRRLRVVILKEREGLRAQ
jgi:tryptophan aminotransferase